MMLRATREPMGNRFQDRTRCSRKSRTIVTVLGQRYRSKAMFHGKVPDASHIWEDLSTKGI